jgi:flagellar hook protein FlgE
MSLSGAMSSAVSAMQAQSAALSTISYNLSNASTTGFKASSTSFSSLLTSSASEVSGGVVASSRANVSASGLTSSTSSATDLSIDGDGFFSVVAGVDGEEIYYTRAGSFEIDDDGYLVSDGYYLVGWSTDSDGNVIGGTTEGNLDVIDTDEISSYAAATTELSLSGNLPANAATEGTFTGEITVYDSLGTAATSTATWTKTGDNTWSVSFSNPVDDDGNEIGTVSSSSITVTFNEDGTLASSDPDPATLTISDWTTGAADSEIAIDLGTAGASNGMTQLSDDDGTLSLTLKSEQDGVAYGSLSGVAIEEDGTVVASYTNGAKLSIAKVPIATFSNSNGLTEMSGSVYAASTSSGSAQYHVAGTDGAGTITDYSLEGSTTDTNTEFSNMIAAQQAYSAASQVLSTASDMFDALLQAVR